MIRQATASDGGDIARIHVETWKYAYKGIVPASYLDDLSAATDGAHKALDIGGRDLVELRYRKRLTDDR